jgi:hypothetical protein
VTQPSQRRSPRIRLQVPVFIRASDEGGDFLELARTINISCHGACIASAHFVRAEQVVHLTIPAPTPLASALIPSGTPPITARVRSHQTAGDLHLLGVEFLKPLE